MEHRLGSRRGKGNRRKARRETARGVLNTPETQTGRQEKKEKGRQIEQHGTLSDRQSKAE